MGTRTLSKMVFPLLRTRFQRQGTNFSCLASRYSRRFSTMRNLDLNDEIKTQLPNAKLKFRSERGTTTADSNKTWIKLTERYPELNNFEMEKVVKFMESLTYYGIEPAAAAEMVLKYPPVLSLSDKDITQTIDTLIGCGFKEEHRQKLLRKFPPVFELKRSEITSRIGFLRTYFENSAESLKVVLNSVEALTDNESILKRKLEYLVIGMSHSTASIKNCDVLSFPLQHMKIRHEFLIRSGLYKPVPYRKLIKLQEQEKGSKMPRLKYFKPDEVVCTTDAQFLKRCTKGIFNTNDLAAFEEVYLATKPDSSDDDLDLLKAGWNPKELDRADEDEESDEEDGDNSVGFGNKSELNQFYF